MSDSTQFEELFKSTFPDIYRLHVLGKPLEEGGGGEVHIWKLVDALLDAHTRQASLKINVSLSGGRIVSIRMDEEVLVNKASRHHSTDRA